MGPTPVQRYFNGNCTSCFSSFHTRHQINNPETVICDLCQQNRLKGIINPIPKMVLSLNSTTNNLEIELNKYQSTINNLKIELNKYQSTINKIKKLILIILLLILIILLYILKYILKY